MSKSPAFQFYPHDFLAGRVATYTMEEVGAYITLLSFDWTLNGLPNSIEKLAKICRVSSRRFAIIWETIADQFPLSEDGKLRNARLQAEREKQLAYSQAMSENGRKGGRPRKPQESRGLAAVKPDESSPSPSPITTSSTSRPSKGKDATSAAPTWAARLAVIWQSEVGSASPGHIGGVLKDVVHKHGEDRVERAMRAYIAVQKSEGKTIRPKWFADQAQVWIDRTVEPPAVVDGQMNATLEMLTRPARSAA